MKKPYWKVKGSEAKFYKFAEAQQFADDIEKVTTVKPTITCYRMLGAIWVSTKIGDK